MEEIIVGLIRRPHGLHGEVHLQVETDAPERVFVPGRTLGVRSAADFADAGAGPPAAASGVPAADEGPLRLTVASARAVPRGWLVRFRELGDRASVERVRGRLLAMPREEVEEPGPGEFFLHELVGLHVWDEAGEVGRVEAVYEAAAQPLLAVRHEGRERLIPFHAAVVLGVDRAARRIRIRPPAGLLEL